MKQPKTMKNIPKVKLTTLTTLNDPDSFSLVDTSYTYPLLSQHVTMGDLISTINRLNRYVVSVKFSHNGDGCVYVDTRVHRLPKSGQYTFHKFNEI